MPTNRRVIVCGVIWAVAAAASPNAQAGMFRNVVRGLEYSGFQFQGATNPLSGGADFSVGRTFVGETLDFGANELTLTGPIGFTFETGGRQLPVLDFSLSTNNQPFEYVFQTSTGAQDYLVEGNFLLDATGSVNTFGFYDLRLQLSSRQDVFLDGRYQDGTVEELDFDLGPIDISGNLFADLLAALFDPLFEGLGVENPFDSFSGRAQRDDLLAMLTADVEAALGDADPLATDQTAKRAQFDEVLPQGQMAVSPVPEPGMLALLLGPLAYLIGRHRRR